jgi:hypothetical protein
VALCRAWRAHQLLGDVVLREPASDELGDLELAPGRVEDLVARTREPSSMAQPDGSDIVYVARVSVPKIIAMRVEIGTRFPPRLPSGYA